MEQHLQEGNKKLPIIINVCIYAGAESPYPYSTDIFDYFELPDLAREKMFKPIALTDLTILSQEELVKDETAGLVKVLLKEGIKRNYLKWIKGNKELISKLLRSTFGISSIIYILGTDNVNEPQELLDAIVEALPGKKDIIMTAAFKLQQESRQEGMQQGMVNKAREVAQKLLILNVDLATIQQATGLSKRELEELFQKSK